MNVLIIGPSGSGKTTLANTLAPHLHLPHIELDDLFWEKNWKTPVLSDFYRRVEDQLKHYPDGCIITGYYNYLPIQKMIWKRADIVIWLDYSLLRCLYRLITRNFSYIINKTPICNGNIETWGHFFSKYSIVLWTIKNYSVRRKEIREAQRNGMLTKNGFFHITNKKSYARCVKKLTEITHLSN
jgi:adenylate kinase family enzyme